MAFSEIELFKIKKLIGEFCEKRTPAEFKDKIRYDYEVKNQDIIIKVIRSHWKDPERKMEMPVAKIKYVRTQCLWKLYWQRANMKWVIYKPFEHSIDLEFIINAIDKDIYGCFFG